MESLRDKLKALFAERYPGCELDLEPRPGDCLAGFLIWPGFESVDQVDRQMEVGRFLRESLSPAEYQSITFVFPFTPHEVAAMRED